MDILISQEVEDLECAVQFFRGRGVEHIHIIGSSMGAAVSIIVASSGCENIVSLITIAAPLDFKKLIYHNTDIKSIEELPPDGEIQFETIKISNRFFKELAEIDLLIAAKKISIPVLIIHGENDDVVGSVNAEIFSECLSSKHRIVIIEDGGHSLTRAKDLSLLKEYIVSWLNSGQF